jgi:Icc-related predicted phosphoesterase
MRIYAAADLHGKQRFIPVIEEGIRQSRADVVVLAGDILNYRGGRPLLFFLDNLPVPVCMVRGNSDPAYLERWARDSRNVRSLHLKSVAFDGVDLVGVGGTLPLPFHSRAGWHESGMLRQLAPKLHARSILVAHPPPHGCRDQVLGRFHAGSRGIARLIRATRPAAMLCGHIHEASGLGRIGDTRVINCALGPNCRGALIVMEDGQAPAIDLL